MITKRPPDSPLCIRATDRQKTKSYLFQKASKLKSALCRKSIFQQKGENSNHIIIAYTYVNK